jgi:hypothetical protein
MITGGPSQYYAEKLAAMENAYIVITGYQDEESPGRKLLNLLNSEEGDRKLEIGGKSIPVKCKIEKVGLSAHGDKGEIKSLINLLSPNNVFLVHGDGEIINSFASEAFSETRGKIYAPKCGETYEINIKNPRKQWKKQMPNIIKSTEELKEDSLAILWEFILDNYGEKLFTIEDLIYIWTGNNKIKALDIEKMEKLMLSSVYFENDARRLFLFKAKNKEQVAEDKKSKELKPNELNDFVNQYFSTYEFKKASLIYGEKKVSLSFNFPDVVNKTIDMAMKDFEKETSWKVEISNKININELDSLIREILYGANIKKISYMLEDKKAIAILNSKFIIEASKIEEFKTNTGLQLLIQNPGTSGVYKEFDNIIESKKNVIVLEQNQTLKLIDESFIMEEFKPYKKSIKNNGKEKYIELCFISPVIGKKYIDKINDLVNKTGWSMKVSETVNQNEIMNLATMLCRKEGITLKKNPSFNATDLSVELKIENLDKEKIENIKGKFEHGTGCKLNFLSF